MRQKWLLFQTLFPIDGVDPFSALQHLFPLDGGAIFIKRSFRPLTPKNVLDDAFNPSVNTFYVLDEAQYETGDFSNNEMQSNYFSQFFPSSFTHSPSGQLLKTRIYKWLQGRYVDRFTARFVEELLKGPWKVNVPSSPHKLLNAYVYQYSSFTPVDAGEDILQAEDTSGSIEVYGWRCVRFFT